MKWQRYVVNEANSFQTGSKKTFLYTKQQTQPQDFGKGSLFGPQSHDIGYVKKRKQASASNEFHEATPNTSVLQPLSMIL